MRRSHVLKRNHNTRLPLRMIWVDTEAENADGLPAAGQQRLTFGVAIFEHYRNAKTTDFVAQARLRFTDAESFWEWAAGFTIRGRALWVMAHNWNYDAGILATSQILPAMGWECVKYINGKPPLIVRWRKNGASLIMIDTLNYFATSVAELGKSTGLPKLTMPPPDAPTDAWDTYAWRDVEIIRAAFLGFRDFVREHDLGVLQPTLASQSFTAFRHRFMAADILIHDNEKALELERAAYHGGRTEAFWRGTVDSTLYKLDINSMYPAIMANQAVGTWIETYFATYQPTWWAYALNGHSMVAECLIDTNEPCYGLVYEDRLIFPVGQFTTVLTTPEIHYALHMGHLTKVKAWAFYKQEIIFDKFVHYFYALRLEYRKNGNPSMDYMSKILMNSLYGKTAQNGRKWTETLDHYWGRPEAGAAQLDDGSIVMLRNRLGQTQILITEDESENSAPIIAAEITAHARMWLWQLIKQAGPDHVYYVDTDSLIVDSEGYEALAHLVDSVTLGGLKLEGESTHSQFWAPKDYTFGGQRVIKGVRKTADELAVCECAKCKKKGNGPAEAVFLQDTFHSWDRNLKNGVDGFVNVVSTTKHLKRENRKRIVNGEDMRTEPIRMG